MTVHRFGERQKLLERAVTEAAEAWAVSDLVSSLMGAMAETTVLLSPNELPIPPGALFTFPHGFRRKFHKNIIQLLRHGNWKEKH